MYQTYIEITLKKKLNLDQSINSIQNTFGINFKIKNLYQNHIKNLKGLLTKKGGRSLRK